MTVWVWMALMLLPALVPQCHAQYGPDPPDTPAEFMCAWRKLAASYAKVNRPDAEGKVHDALQLSKYCPGMERRRDEELPKVFPPHRTRDSVPSDSASTVYVDAEHGSDRTGTGVQSKPFATVAKGVASAATVKGGTVILRNGTYYLHDTVQIPPTAHGLSIEGMPGETAWVSGGTKLDPVEWKPHNLTHGMNIWSADLSHLKLDSVPGLRVNERRVSPARYPNADPELTFWPVGYMTSQGTKKTAVAVAGGGGGCAGFNGPMSCGTREPCATGCTASWKAPKISPKPNPAKVVNVTSAEQSRLWDVQFSHYSGGIGGTCSIYDPPFSFWCSSPPFSAGCGGCFTWNIPAGIDAPAQMLQNYDKERLVSNGHVVAWRAAHWANWHFEIDDYSWEAGGNASITFGRGGFQGARGGPGSDWYISNVYEELDTPTEYYYDIKLKTLYYFGNGTHGEAPTETFVATKLHTLFNVSGASKDAPLRDFTLKGVGLRDTSPTMLEPHAVPSGGDWALERIGAVFLQNTEHATITGCEFTRIGGNGVMISAYNQYTIVSHSEFAWMGGSAIAAWGWTDEISDGGIHGVDGTHGHFPRYTQILFNLFREVGVWEKQSSAFFQAKAAESLLKGNVVFNLARAGFNFNDGFGGGDNITENVLFHTCRESSDHGPINSWDRQPFVTNVRTGKPSTQMQWRRVHKNVVIANYGGSKQVDNDDGSLFWKVYSNFMAYGWCQKFKCGGIESYDNVKAFVDLGGKFNAGCVTEAPGTPVGQEAVFAPNVWRNDIMISLSKTEDFQYRQAWGTQGKYDWDKSQISNITIYLAKSNLSAVITGTDPERSTPLTQWVSEGNDPGSRQINTWPQISTVIEWAEGALGTFAPAR